MCGIVTIYSYGNGSARVNRDELVRMRDRMKKRGPDGQGEWFSADGRVGLGHRRLAIIDLSDAAAQPMTNEDNSLVITFNGEIYNYQALRSELVAKGRRFRSASDTEVLLQLYAEKGPEMVHDLRGMYAFAIWDARKHGLFLARDPFGIKPLYYADDGKMFRAASQVKALLAGGQIDTAPDPAGHTGYFLWGHVPEPYTMYKGIRSLPAGTSLWVGQDGKKSSNTFYRVSIELAQACDNPVLLGQREMQAHLRNALLDTVRHHLIADVPVGVFLSSGLDSTTLTALAAEAGVKDLHTVTLGFREFQGTASDEVPLAEQTAKYYGTKHRTIWLEKVDFETDLAQLFDAMDQPSTDGVNSYFVSKAAGRAGLKVVLSGLGGDELFGSYPSFRQVPRSVNALGLLGDRPVVGKAFRALSAPLLKYFTSPKYAGILEYGGSYGGAYLLRRSMFMPWELPEILDPEMARDGWKELQTLPRLEETVKDINSDYLKVSALEMSWYMRSQLLRDMDWASMAHSLEIRVPFVDVKFMDAVAPLFASVSPPTKRDMASAPVKPLLARVLNREKTGFVVPVREWLMKDEPADRERGLRGWAVKVYSEDRANPIIRVQEPSYPNFHRREGFRILVLLTDGFGGHGGIALYNRDLLTALCAHPGCKEVVAIPRLMPNRSEPQPANLTYVTSGLKGKISYLKAVQQTVRKNPGFDLIVCGHINLIPIACMLRLKLKAPIILEIYGIDAWQPTRSLLVNKLVNKIDGFVSISDVTRQRFLAWTNLPAEKGFLLPNAIHLDEYGPGPKNPDLLKRYGLEGKTVLMTLGRLVSQERYKGFDEVMEVLSELAKERPNIAYLIVGKGSDQHRLEKKARTLGIEDRVVFTGFIPHTEKADHFRLADAYVMPSKGEGFGFVFLEAMACGVPAIGSILDGSREALRDGLLGILVDPAKPEEIKAGILFALKSPRGEVPDGLWYFSFENFAIRLFSLVDTLGLTARTTGVLRVRTMKAGKCNH